MQDGLARLTLDEDKLPAIQPIKKRDHAGDAAGGGGGGRTSDNKQLIINMSMQEWRVSVTITKRLCMPYLLLVYVLQSCIERECLY